MCCLYWSLMAARWGRHTAPDFRSEETSISRHPPSGHHLLIRDRGESKPQYFASSQQSFRANTRQRANLCRTRPDVGAMLRGNSLVNTDAAKSRRRHDRKGTQRPLHRDATRDLSGVKGPQSQNVKSRRRLKRFPFCFTSTCFHGNRGCVHGDVHLVSHSGICSRVDVVRCLWPPTKQPQPQSLKTANRCCRLNKICQPVADFFVLCGGRDFFLLTYPPPPTPLARVALVWR